MKTFDLLNPICDFFNGLPVIDGWIKKERLTSADCWSLRYAALRIIDRNFFREDWKVIDDENDFQDSELYLLGFEGYDIDETYNLRTIFLTTKGQIMARIYNKATDKFDSFLID